MPRRDRATAADADLALAVLLEPLAEGSRVLWIGRDPGGPASLLAEVAGSVRAFHPEGSGTGAGAPGVKLGVLRPDGPSFRRGSFDLVVVPDLAEVALDDHEAVGRLDRCRGDDGTLVVGLGAWGEDVAVVDAELRALVRDVEGPGRGPFGQTALASVATARLAGDERDGDDVVFDGSVPDRLGRSAAEGRSPSRLVWALGPRADELDPYLIVATGGVPSSTGEAGSPSEPPPESRPAPAVADADDKEVARLEAALAERGRVVNELQDEVRRRGALVRDLVEELRGRGVEPALGGEDGSAPGRVRAPEPTPPSSEALERALDAELALTEARFRIDELTAALAAARDRETPDSSAPDVGPDAPDLEDEIRALTARLAEVDERAGFLEARAMMLEMDAEDARGRVLGAQRRAAELEDEVGRLLAREHAAGSAVDRRAHSLLGELAGLRHRLADREAAWRSMADGGAGGRLESLERDLAEARAREARATLELSASEERAESAEARVVTLEAERAADRERIEDDARRRDEAERALAEAKGILAGLSGLGLEAAEVGAEDGGGHGDP